MTWKDALTLGAVFMLMFMIALVTGIGLVLSPPPSGRWGLQEVGAAVTSALGLMFLYSGTISLLLAFMGRAHPGDLPWEIGIPRQ